MAFTPYNSDEPVRRHRLNLPHWRQWERTYFVTARLEDSVPRHLKDHWHEQRRTWLSQRGFPPDVDTDKLPDAERIEFHRTFTARFHELLDAGHGSCVLAGSGPAEILVSLLTAGHGVKYQLDAWVIMPNHFHALVEPAENITLGAITKIWKGSSARAINLLLGRAGKLWQAEAFDHIVRSEEQLEHFRRYIARNPEKAGLKSGFLKGIGDRIEET